MKGIMLIFNFEYAGTQYTLGRYRIAMDFKPWVFETCFGVPFSRRVLPIADLFNPVGAFNSLFYLTFLFLKGINMSAQGIALRQQDRFRNT